MATRKQSGKNREYAVGKGKPPIDKQFKPGNQASKGHGRPKTLKELRTLIQKLANEPASKQEEITRLEVMLRQMMVSRSPANSKTVLEYGYGKVPDETRGITVDWSQLTDEQIERIANGEDVFTVLAATRAGEVRGRTEEAAENKPDQSGA